MTLNKFLREEWVTINTTEKVEELMLEHLKNLKEAAEDCDECQLGGIILKTH